MTSPPDGFFYDYQTLATGLIATFAAFVTAGSIWLSARLSISHKKEKRAELDDRRKRVGCLALSSDLQTLQRRARQAGSTIHVVIASNASVNDDIRARVRLPIPDLISDWEFMGLLSPKLANELMALSRLILDHNFDMDRAGGSFGDDNFRKHVQDQVKAIGDRAGPLGVELIESYKSEAAA